MRNPETKEFKPFPKAAVSFALGLMLILISAIAIINLGLPSQFLAYGTAFFFGYFYFVPWLTLAAFGLWLMYFKKLKKHKKALLYTGLIILFIAILTITSNATTGGSINIDNYNATYLTNIGPISEINSHPLDIYHSSLGGGYIGFMLAGLFNSGLTSIGTYAVFSFVGLVGLVLIFMKLLIKGFKKLNTKRKEAHAKRIAAFEEAKNVESEEENIPTQEDLNNITPRMSYDLGSKPEEEKEETKPSIPAQPVSDPNQYEFSARVITDNRGMTKAYLTIPGMTLNSSSKEEIASSPKKEVIVEEVEVKKETVFENTKSDELIGKEEIMQESVIEEEIRLDLSKPKYDADLVATPSVEATTLVVKREETAIKEEDSGATQPKALPRSKYVFPSIDLLNDYEVKDDISKNIEVADERSHMIDAVFADFKVGAAVTGYTIGPSITRFDILPNRDVSVSAISRTIDDISVRVGGITARFEAIVRGRNTCGLEIPNAIKTIVGFKETFKELPKVEGYKNRLYIPFGKDIAGAVIAAPLDEFPHLLIAGTTGSGKSIYMHSVIMSLIMRNRPEDLKLMIVDPKRVEMVKYKDMPHLLCPIITDSNKAKVGFYRLVDEMERRYDLFANSGCSNIKKYNEYADEEGLEPLPYLVAIVDEFADLVQSCKDIAMPVMRLGQKSRAAGIHMIIATQRPAVNIITGDIKANLPVRVALATASYTDSMTMVGVGGAELLLGNGDMLVDCAIISRQGLSRLQGCFVDDREIKRVVDFIKAESEPKYDPNFLDLVEKSANNSDFSGGYQRVQEKDDMYDVVREVIQTREYTSISQIQREFGFGFPRAGKIFEQLKQNGIVAKEPDTASSAKGCRVLVRSNTPVQTADENGEAAQSTDLEEHN